MNPGTTGGLATSNKLKMAGLSMIKPPSITTFKPVPKAIGFPRPPSNELQSLPPPQYGGLNRGLDFPPQQQAKPEEDFAGKSNREPRYQPQEDDVFAVPYPQGEVILQTPPEPERNPITDPPEVRYSPQRVQRFA